MDKYEYQVCADQIKSLIANRRFAEAMDIADTIDWRRVKSFSMLCTVSEIYKVNKHYDESRDILLLAYERYPDRANVVYALCELAVKLNDIAEAVDYYKEFVRIRPNDTNRYVLLYKIYDAQEVSIEERIALLEEFRRAEYTEKWAYELALLYHKNGQERKCIEECDELILWFGEGPYVRKAMELKMQHADLTPEQQMKYDGVANVAASSPVEMAPEAPAAAVDYSQQSAPDNSQYYAQNNAEYGQQYPENQYPDNSGQYYQQNSYEQSYPANDQMQQGYVPENQPQQTYAQNDQYVMGSDQPYDPTYTYQDIQVQPVNTDKYSTLNLQEELAKNMAEIYDKGDIGIAAPYYGETSQLYEPSQRQYLENLQAYGQNNDFANAPVNKAFAEQPTPMMSQNQMPMQEQMMPESQVETQAVSEEMMAEAVDQMMGIKPNLQEAPMQAETEMLAMQARPDNYVSEPQAAVQEPVVQMQPQVQPVTEPQAAVQEPVVQMQPQAQPVAEPQAAVQEPVAQMQPQAQPVAEPQAAVQEPAVQMQPQAQPVAEPQAAVQEPAVQMQPQAQPVAEPQMPVMTEQPSQVVLQAQAEAKYTEEQLENLAKLEKVLTQDGGGQISLSFPLDEAVEKQITGQIDISDFLAEWNAKKKSKEEQRRKELREKSLSQTSDIMAQLAGVIPGLEEAVRPREPEPANKPIIPIENIGKTKEPVETPVFTKDSDNGFKRTESGSKINGIRVSEITGAIPSVLPSATGAIPKPEVKPAEQAKPIEEPKQTEDSFVSLAETVPQINDETPKAVPEEISEEISEEKDLVAELNTADVPLRDMVGKYMEPTVAVAEGIVGEVETKPVEGKREIEDVSFESNDVVEEMEDIDVKELPDELKEEPADYVEEELPISEGEGIPAVNGEKDNTAYELPEEEDVAEESEEIESDEGADLSEGDFAEEDKRAFPYELEDDNYGEIEEIELIDQPDDVDDMLKTGKLPIEDLTAYGEYGGMDDGGFNGYSQNVQTPEAPTGHPSYMVMESAPTSRRDFDPEEMAIFGRFEGIEALKAQIVDAVDDMSMEARRGNVVVFGSELYGRKLIAIDVVKAMQVMDSEFSGKVAKISGEALNKKNIPMTLAKLANGALIVENAGGLTPITVNTITDTLINDVDSILVVFEGDKDTLEPLLMGCNQTRKVFNASITIPEFNNNDLVSYGKGYARELEYSIDEMGELALHTRISDMQTIDHIVSVDEVQEIVDAAIHHVDRKNMSHFMDVLVGKRYDDDDYIVLREKDFTSI